jgi:glycosyltransferase involved in cell wall biosynthesis
MKDVTVIIPTYRRAKDLAKLLQSLDRQTVKPYKIIVVDDTPDKSIENLIIYRSYQIDTPNRLSYVRGRGTVTSARNIGASLAQTDILLFLDSDTTLARDYIEKILEVYRLYPSARGVQGFIVLPTAPHLAFWHCLGRLYCWQQFLEKERCKMYTPIVFSYPRQSLNKIISCEWMTSSNASFTKETTKEFEWDETIMKPAGEDLDYSYRIHKKYPSSLYLTPFAKLLHLSSSEGRWPDTSEQEYLYLFRKLMPQTIKNKLLFNWNRMAIKTIRSTKAFIHRFPIRS